ncbi:MAG: hypothetical protein WCO44_07345 [Bacteroidota bacterium]
MITEYPSGLIPLCLLLGALYAWVLYYRDVKRGMANIFSWGMAALRFLSVSLIAFLLLSPLIKRTEKRLEKPVIVIGVDNSQSMVMGNDSTWCRNTFPGQLKQLVATLQQKCEVRVYSFDDKLTNGFSGTYKGSKTDISVFFREVNTRYTNRNAAAVILATDGIYNEGTDPFYAAQKIPFPVYTLAMGDTILKKDISILKVLVNKTAYRGDKFPVEVLVAMNKCNGLKTKISLSQGTRLIESRELRATGDRSLQRATFLLEAKEAGMTRYSLQLDKLEGEGSPSNNHIDFLVEVLEARQKIALVSAAPHPDIMAIEKALEGSSHFEVETIITETMPRSFEKYDLVILNQLPSITNVTDLTGLLQSKVPLLVIVGSQTDLNALNRLQAGLIVNSPRNAFSESQPSFNPDFSLFTVDQKDQAVFREFPPLQCPFGAYQVSPLAEVLFYQKIGNVATKTPMVVYTHALDRKVGIIAGENIWRWRISNYIQQSNHESFDLWIDKTAQYLSAKDDKSFFRIRTKNKSYENEPVEFEAELYNGSYELINQPDVSLTLTDHENKSYPFVFSKTRKGYFLNAGMFPAGEYNYKAAVKSGQTGYEKTGKLFIEKVNIESSNLVADHNLLFRIASAHDGEMVRPADIGKLAGKILARNDIRSVAIYQNRMSDLIGNPWLFALIVLLLTAEWVIRKREGL